MYTYLVPVQGVENVYTQHTPLLVNTLEMLVKGRLKDSDYPAVSSWLPQSTTKAPKLVLAYIVGGTTYEESKAIAELNAQVVSANLLSQYHH